MLREDRLKLIRPEIYNSIIFQELLKEIKKPSSRALLNIIDKTDLNINLVNCKVEDDEEEGNSTLSHSESVENLKEIHQSKPLKLLSQDVNIQKRQMMETLKLSMQQNLNKKVIHKRRNLNNKCKKLSNQDFRPTEQDLRLDQGKSNLNVPQGQTHNSRITSGNTTKTKPLKTHRIYTKFSENRPEGKTYFRYFQPIDSQGNTGSYISDYENFADLTFQYPGNFQQKIPRKPIIEVHNKGHKFTKKVMAQQIFKKLEKLGKKIYQKEELLDVEQRTSSPSMERVSPRSDRKFINFNRKANENIKKYHKEVSFEGDPDEKYDQKFAIKYQYLMNKMKKTEVDNLKIKQLLHHWLRNS